MEAYQLIIIIETEILFYLFIYLFLLEDLHGNPITEIQDEDIPLLLVQDLNNLCVTNNWTMEDAVTYHRNTLLSNGYVPSSFRPNIPESYFDKRRSLVATYPYQHRIQQFKGLLQ